MDLLTLLGEALDELKKALEAIDEMAEEVLEADETKGHILQAALKVGLAHQMAAPFVETLGELVDALGIAIQEGGQG